MQIKKDTKGDINSLEDRLWACANLISLEEHNYSSWLRTKSNMWLEDMNECRRQRQQLMSEILGEGSRHGDAEIWCMFKHNAAAAFRLWESGNRFSVENPGRAERYYDMSRNRIGVMLALIESVKEKETLSYIKNHDYDYPSIEEQKTESSNHKTIHIAVPTEDKPASVGGQTTCSTENGNIVRYRINKVLEYLKCCL